MTDSMTNLPTNSPTNSATNLPANSPTNLSANSPNNEAAGLDPSSLTNLAGQIAESYGRVRARIDDAALRNGRDPRSVLLLPVSKFHPVTAVQAVAAAGATAVGENRITEAQQKHREFPLVDYHIIGQVQRNKANILGRFASCVQSVDSVEVADSLAKGTRLALERGQRDHNLDVYLQLSLDGNPQRGGVVIDRLLPLADHVESLPDLNLVGLMVVLPVGQQDYRPAAEARDLLAEHLGRKVEFSAGMSGDFEQAIAAGSTMVRVGTEIFGSRV